MIYRHIIHHARRACLSVFTSSFTHTPPLPRHDIEQLYPLMSIKTHLYSTSATKNPARPTVTRAHGSSSSSSAAAASAVVDQPQGIQGVQGMIQQEQQQQAMSWPKALLYSLFDRYVNPERDMQQGKQNQILKMLGFYGSYAVAMRAAKALHANAVDHAISPKFLISLGLTQEAELVRFINAEPSPGTPNGNISNDFGLGDVRQLKVARTQNKSIRSQDQQDGDQDQDLDNHLIKVPFELMFQLSALHVWLILRGFRDVHAGVSKEDEKILTDIIQDVSDLFFQYLETYCHKVEKLGILATSTWMKECQKVFYGMIVSYDEILENQTLSKPEKKKLMIEASMNNIICLKNDKKKATLLVAFIMEELDRFSTYSLQDLLKGKLWEVRI